MSAWVAAAIAFAALLVSVGGVVFVAGRQTQKITDAQEDIVQLNAAVSSIRATASDIREAAEREIKELRKSSDMENKEIRDGMHELLGALKEFTREQSAVNVGVTKTLEACTRRLELVGDLVMEHKATIEIHGEILHRKGLVSGE